MSGISSGRKRYWSGPEPAFERPRGFAFFVELPGANFKRTVFGADGPLFAPVEYRLFLL